MVDTSTEAVTKLLDVVTPGPWEMSSGRVVAVKNTVADLRYKNGRTDGMFIAAARDLVPALLAERDALWDEVDRINAQPLTVEDAAKVPEVQALIKAAQDLDRQFCDNDLGPSALAMGKLREAYMRLK